MTVVLDTNVLVSATLSDGPPSRILELAETGDITAVTSPGILEETRDVLTRDRIPFENEQVDAFIEKVLSASQVIAPETDIEVIEDDPDDDKIVECAAAADVDYIISGDSHLLDLEQYEGIRILAPADYLDLINRNNN